MEVEQKRSARVHRVAESEFAGNDSGKTDEPTAEGTSGKEKLGSIGVDESIQREASVFEVIEDTMYCCSPSYRPPVPFRLNTSSGR